MLRRRGALVPKVLDRKPWWLAPRASQGCFGRGWLPKWLKTYTDYCGPVPRKQKGGPIERWPARGRSEHSQKSDMGGRRLVVASWRSCLWLILAWGTSDMEAPIRVRDPRALPQAIAGGHSQSIVHTLQPLQGASAVLLPLRLDLGDVALQESRCPFSPSPRQLFVVRRLLQVRIRGEASTHLLVNTG